KLRARLSRMGTPRNRANPSRSGASRIAAAARSPRGARNTRCARPPASVLTAWASFRRQIKPTEYSVNYGTRSRDGKTSRPLRCRTDRIRSFGRPARHPVGFCTEPTDRTRVVLLDGRPPLHPAYDAEGHPG